MKVLELILIGAGGHARSCIDVIERQGLFQIIGLVGLQEQHDGISQVCGYPIIGTDKDLPDISKNYKHALITIGQIQSAEPRIRFYQEAIQLGFQLPTIVSPNAYVSGHATLGAGTIVMHGAIINAGVSIGNNCIINSRALVEHDARVEDDCHISTGAVLNGDVKIGASSFIGSGSIIKQGISIGRSCVVGMGLGVRSDLNDCIQFTGYDVA